MPPGAVVAFRVILAPDINVMTYLLTYLALRQQNKNLCSRPYAWLNYHEDVVDAVDMLWQIVQFSVCC